MYGTILVVDDNEDLRENTRLMLSRQGYEVWLAPDGNSAKKLLDQPVLASAVCTVICDLAMSNGNGTDLITYLRKHHPTVPILVYSGTNDTVFLQGILQDGVCDWMRKPVSRDTMLPPGTPCAPRSSSSMTTATFFSDSRIVSLGWGTSRSRSTTARMLSA